MTYAWALFDKNVMASAEALNELVVIKTTAGSLVLCHVEKVTQRPEGAVKTNNALQIVETVLKYKPVKKADMPLVFQEDMP